MEDFVNFSIAKKLKEKGFREECFARYYCSDKAYFEENSYNPNTESIFYCYNNDEDLGRFYIDAPTISQTLKWLRDEKEYHIQFVGNACGYLFIISDIPSKGGTDRYCSDYSRPNDGGTWDKYEDCAKAAIEYVLYNLI